MGLLTERVDNRGSKPRPIARYSRTNDTKSMIILPWVSPAKPDSEQMREKASATTFMILSSQKN